MAELFTTSPRSSIPSPLTTQLPHLSPAQIAALPYPPDLLPGARDVQTSYGRMRVYEWGNEAGRKVMMVHGDATCAPVWKTIAEGLVARGCRVIVFDLWGRGYTDSPSAPHTSRLLALQLLFATSSSPLPWCSEKFSVIGFSLGGSITLDFAASFPHLVRSVALLAPAGLLRTLPQEYVDLKKAASEGANGEVLRGLVGAALGVVEEQVVEEKDVDPDAKKDFSKLYRWQFEHHQGHVRSFASTLLHGPVQGQEEAWRVGCGVLEGKRLEVGGGGERLVVVCAGEDDVVRAGDVREDLIGFLGEDAEGEAFIFETLPGGHGFLADEAVCEKVVEILGKEWGF